jgi:hypothetical protein
MRFWILGGLACVMLGGAQNAAAATLPARAAGLWQSTTTVSGADGKPLVGATDVVTVSCVDPATDLKFFTSGGSACSSLVISGHGQTYAIKGQCVQHGRPVVIDETLLYDSPQVVTLSAQVDAGGRALKVVSKLQWQGSCLAGMQPGDEGNITGGVFNKADNINDSADQ